MPSLFAIAAGPSSARNCLICAASMLTGRPLYFPAAFALAMPSNTRTKNQAASFGTSSIGSDTFLGAEEEHRGQCSFSYFLRDIPHFMQSPEMKSNL